MTISAAHDRLVLGSELAGTRMTPEEFDAIEEYDDDCRHDLIHGALLVTPIPLPAEVDPNEELTVFGRQVLPAGERRVLEHEVCSTKSLPGFVSRLARLLALADAWK